MAATVQPQHHREFQSLNTAFGHKEQNIHSFWMQLHPASSAKEEPVTETQEQPNNRALPSEHVLIVLLLVTESREGGKRKTTSL